MRSKALTILTVQLGLTAALALLALRVDENNRLNHFASALGVDADDSDMLAVAIEARSRNGIPDPVCEQAFSEISDSLQAESYWSPASAFAADTLGQTVMAPPTHSSDNRFEVAYYYLRRPHPGQIATIDALRGRLDRDLMAVGTSMVNAYLDLASSRIRVRFCILFIVCLVLVAAIFRSWSAVIWTGLSVLSPIAVTMGLFALTGHQLDLVTNLIPVLVMVLGFAMQMHLMLSAIRHRSAITGLRHKLYPNLLVTLSTSIGFFSLITSHIEPVRVLGIFMALGVWLVYLFSTITAMGIGRLFTNLPLRPSPRLDAWVARIAAPRAGFLTAGMLLVSGLVLAGGSLALWRAQVQSNGLQYFSDEHPLRQQTHAFERQVTGTALFTISRPNAPEDGADLADVLRRVPAVRHVFALPSQSSQHWRLGVTANSMDSAAYLRLKTAITSALSQAGLPAVEFGGPLHVSAMIQHELIGSLARSLCISIASISLMIMLILPIRVGLMVAWLPNLFPLGCMALGMAIFGIDLSIASILVFSIAYGIAVDDSIHLSHRYLCRGQGRAKNWTEVIHTEGLAVGLTTLILTLGFASLGISTFTPIADFGKLLSIGMAAALIGDLWILPALLGIGWIQAHTNSCQGERDGD